MTESQDDLASRGRTIFQRLRGSEPRESGTTGIPGGRDEAADTQGEDEPEEKPAGAGVLTDGELASFSAPPPS